MPIDPTIADAITDALHPEFGTEWQEPDGIIWKALAEREAEVRERIAAETRKEADRFRRAATHPPTKRSRRRWIAQAAALERWASHITR